MIVTPRIWIGKRPKDLIFEFPSFLLPTGTRLYYSLIRVRLHFKYSHSLFRCGDLFFFFSCSTFAFEFRIRILDFLLWISFHYWLDFAWSEADLAMWLMSTVGGFYYCCSVDSLSWDWFLFSIVALHIRQLSFTFLSVCWVCERGRRWDQLLYLLTMLSSNSPQSAQGTN